MLMHFGPRVVVSSPSARDTLMPLSLVKTNVDVLPTLGGRGGGGGGGGLIETRLLRTTDENVSGRFSWMVSAVRTAQTHT